MFPLRRNRRLRNTQAIRSLVQETILSPHDFIVPLFVVEGKGIQEEISSMPNYYRYPLCSNDTQQGCKIFMTT